MRIRSCGQKVVKSVMSLSRIFPLNKQTPAASWDENLDKPIFRAEMSSMRQKLRVIPNLATNEKKA
jgi:hypothetical protein